MSTHQRSTTATARSAAAAAAKLAAAPASQQPALQAPCGVPSAHKAHANCPGAGTAAAKLTVPAPQVTVTPGPDGGAVVTPAEPKPCNKISAHGPHAKCPGVPVVEHTVDANGGQPTAGENAHPEHAAPSLEAATAHHTAKHSKSKPIEKCGFQQCKAAVAAATPAAPAAPAAAPRSAPKPAGAKMKVADRIPLIVKYLGNAKRHTGTFAEMGAALGCSANVAAYSTKDSAAALAEAGLTVVVTKGSYAVTVAPAKTAETS
jgi:hypothetical protein